MTTPTTAPASKRRDFWLRGPGLILVIVIGGLILTGGALGIARLSGNLNPGPAGKDLAVTLQSCDVSPYGNATVGVSVTNHAKTVVTAEVRVEYRDTAGARLDSDTLYVRKIAPGDTARGEEMTNLDAQASTIKCVVTSVAAR